MTKNNLFESPQTIDSTFPDTSASDLDVNLDGQSNSGKSGRSVRMHERVKRPELTAAELQQYIMRFRGNQLWHEPETVPMLDGDELFGIDGLVTWDYGCGRGEYLQQLAQDNPDKLHVGVDIHGTSLAIGARAASIAGLDNIKFIRADGDLLIPRIPDQSAEAASVLFPAPQPEPDGSFKGMPKPKFAAQIHRTLETDGSPFTFASDSAPYFAHRMRQIGASGLYTLDPDEYTISTNGSGAKTRYQRTWESKDIPTHRAVMRKAE